MNKLRFLVILIFSLGVFTSCQRRQHVQTKAVVQRADGALELTLVSFNVRYENEEDLGDRSWKTRVVPSVHLLQQLRPDVFGVQEALHGQAADLWASLPDYQFFGVGRDDGKRLGEYAGIFYRRDRFEPDPSDCGTFWLSDTPEKPGSMTWGNTFPRIAAWVRLVDRASGRAFYAFNTHWDHKNQHARECSARMIAQKIDTRRHSGEPVVLLGDFNANEANPAVAYLRGQAITLAGSSQRWEKPLLDPFQLLHPDQKNRRTLHFWTRNQEGSLKVDHILVSAGAKVVSSAILSQTPQMVSDHFPVTAKVVFPRP